MSGGKYGVPHSTASAVNLVLADTGRQLIVTGHYDRSSPAALAAVEAVGEFAMQEFQKQAIATNTDEPPPPLRLSNDPSHRDFHPSYGRVGVRIDGAERRDCIWYDAPAGRYLTLGTGRKGDHLLAHSIEPFWRWAESRQERRARERWEAKHGCAK